MRDYGTSHYRHPQPVNTVSTVVLYRAEPAILEFYFITHEDLTGEKNIDFDVDVRNLGGNYAMSKINSLSTRYEVTLK